ncbi:RDD family protein [Candidatus Poriferisodalis sp.]|uniref:RDD family protein n=1 Tax=Candidatus Poriferisodalis sp. TaxID=3101277 RepID=UPI003B5CA455
MGDGRAELVGGSVLAVERVDDPFAFHLDERRIPRSDLAHHGRVQPVMTSTTMAARFPAQPPAFLSELRGTVAAMRTPFRHGPSQPEITLRSGRDVALATFKERAAARGIDLVLAGLVVVLATVLMGCLAYARLVTGDEGEPYGWLLAPLVIVFAALFLTAAHETWATSATGQSRGKRLKGIQVVRLRDGRKPGVAASFVRAALPVSASLCGLVLIWTACARSYIGVGTKIPLQSMNAVARPSANTVLRGAMSPWHTT